MINVTGIVDVSAILKRGQHPAAIHSHNMQRRRWDAGGPVWEWYSIYGRYCHQHDHKQCGYST